MSADASDGADLARNAASTERLRGLAARLGEADLRRPLGGGWDVAFALAHLAFRDARQEAAIRRWADGGAFAQEDAAVNEALEAIASLVDADAAATAAVEAAARLDAAVDGLGEARRAALRRGGGRVRHRPLAPPRGARRADRGRAGLTPPRRGGEDAS